MQFWNRQARMSLALILLAASCSGMPEESWEAALARQTKELPRVTRAEIYLVGEPDENVPEPRFPIRPYENFAPILGQCEVTGAQAEELAAIWRAMEFKGGGAMCHYPVYALRLYSDDELVLETSLCWDCFNCYVEDGTTDHRWLGFGDIDFKLGQRLRALLTPPPRVGSAFAVKVGSMLMHANNMQGALAKYDDALRLDPTNPEAYKWRARFFTDTGELHSAIKELSEGLKRVSPHSRAVFLGWRGQLYAESGEYQRAIEDLTECIKQKKEDFVYADVSALYLLRAEYYDKLGKTAEAEADRKRAEPPPREVDEFESTENTEPPEESETPPP